MNDFINKAVLNVLRKTYDIDFVHRPSRNPNYREYFLKFKIDNVYIFTRTSITEGDDLFISLSQAIDKSSEKFYQFLEKGGQDFNYLKFQVRLRSDFEGRVSIYYGGPRTPAFIREVYQINERDVISCLLEFEETTLSEYLPKQITQQPTQ